MKAFDDIHLAPELPVSGLELNKFLLHASIIRGFRYLLTFMIIKTGNTNIY